MRLWPHLPQLRQTAVNYSGASRGLSAAGVIFHLVDVGASQPVRQLIAPESPLSAKLDRWNFFALGPKTDRASRNTKPFRNRGSCQEWFIERKLFHMPVSIGLEDILQNPCPLLAASSTEEQ